MLGPNFLDLNSQEQGDHCQPSTVSVASSFVENESLHPTVFYKTCSLLDEEQLKLFNLS